jgi:hypothetical protein
MRRIILGSTAIWVVGGTLLAQEPKVSIPGIAPAAPPPIVLVKFGDQKSAGPATQGLQPLATPDGVTIKQVVAPLQAPATLPNPSPPAPIPADESYAPVTPYADAHASEPVKFFGQVDYLLFWMRGNPTPPLVQVLPPSLANFNLNGGNLPPGAGRSIFGEDGVDRGMFNGARVMLGTYFEGAKGWGIDASYLELFQKSDNFAISSPGIPVIGRDFFDTTAQKDSFLRYTTPDGLSTGFIDVHAPTQMYTFDANLRAEGPSMLSDRVDYFSGLRYLNLRDSLTIDSGVSIRDSVGATPFTVLSHEGFKATNEFYAGQVGLETHYHWGCFSIEFTGKFAFGSVHQEARIDGFSTTQVGAAPPTTFPNQSILLVQPSNVGTFTRNRFAVMPEGLVNIGYQITPHIRATIGYDVWDLSSVIRSGQAIDPNVNPSLTKYIAFNQTSPIRQPTFSFANADDWWANGLTLGLSFTY